MPQVSAVRTLTSSTPAASSTSSASSSSIEPPQAALPASRGAALDGRHAAEHAVAQRLDDLAALDQRAGVHAVLGAAVVLGDDEVLRHVDQAARQVAGVRGLQRRVGQTLAGAVRRDEVLQNVEAFAEVRRDRRLDDRAVRLGHQAAHARQLADLRCTRARRSRPSCRWELNDSLIDFPCRCGRPPSAWRAGPS